MRIGMIFTSVFALISYLIFVTGEEVKCSVKVELTSDRMLQMTNQDEFCSCLKYEGTEKTSTSAEPCELETRTVGGRLAISVENICVCAGYKTDSTKKEIISNPTLTEKGKEAVFLPPKEKNDSFIAADREKTLSSVHTIDIPKINETEIHLIETTTIDTIIFKALKEELSRPTSETEIEVEMMPSKEYMSHTTVEIDDPKTEIPELIKCVSFILNSTSKCNNSEDVSDSSKILTFLTVSLANDTTDHDLDELTVNFTSTKSIDTINPINKTIGSKIIRSKKDPINPYIVINTTVVNIASEETNTTFDKIKPREFITKINVTENINVTSDDVLNKTTVLPKSSDYDYKYYIKVFSLNKTIVVDGKIETTTLASDLNEDLLHYEEYMDPEVSMDTFNEEEIDSVIYSTVKTEKTVEATTKIAISYKHDHLSSDTKKARENFLKVLVIVLLTILLTILIVVVILHIIYSCISRGSYAVAQVAERNLEMKPNDNMI